MPKLRLLLSLLAILILAACNREVPLASLGSEAVVLAFGDSLTFGTGAPAEETYPAVLARLLGRQVINAGRPGETSGEGVTRLPALLAEHRPQLVILCHGGNDLLRRLEAGELRQNLLRMVALAREAGAEVLLVAVPQPGIFLSPAPLYQEIAAELRLPFEEEILSEVLADRRLKSDSVHPNAAGYARIAEALARRINRSQR